MAGPAPTILMGAPKSRWRGRRGRRAVFLDRDGVLNHGSVRDGKLYAPRRLQDFRLLSGVRQAARALKRAGYLIVVVTNQPDIGNGRVAAAEVAGMNRRLMGWLAPNAIVTCPHAQSAGCTCRKPRPGMLLEGAKLLDVDLSRSVMIGDRESDIVAGGAAGCYTIWVGRPLRGEKRPHAVTAAFCLPAAARLWLRRARRLSRGGAKR